MNMFLVSMNGYDESVFAFRKSARQFIADFQRFLRGYLTGFEGLPYLICQNIAVALAAPGEMLVIFFRKNKFLVNRARVALEPGDQFALFCFIRVLGIIGAVENGLSDGLAFVGP
jgi:hypothetical protein